MLTLQGLLRRVFGFDNVAEFFLLLGPVASSLFLPVQVSVSFTASFSTGSRAFDRFPLMCPFFLRSHLFCFSCYRIDCLILTVDKNGSVH